MIRLAFLTVVLLIAEAYSLSFEEHSGLDTSKVIGAMQSELTRSLDSLAVSPDKPYYMSYLVWEVRSFVVQASLGSVEISKKDKENYVDVDVRVGNYKRDNSNFEGFLSYSAPIDAPFPQDDNPLLIRQCLWAATDAAYRTAREQFPQKLSYLNNKAGLNDLDDFTPQKASQNFSVESLRFPDSSSVIRLTSDLSRGLSEYSFLSESRVAFQYYHTTFYFVNSEGSRFIQSFGEYTVLASLLTQAEDGEPLWDYYRETRRDPPDSEWLKKGKEELKIIAARLEKLRNIPPEAHYRGPVLFSETAAGEVINASLLKVQRILRPALRDGMTEAFLLGLLGKKYFPRQLSITDDPALKTFAGRTLHGHYTFDHEGQNAKPVDLIRQGRLMDVYKGRTPLPGRVHTSNGHLRYGEGTPGVVIVDVKKPQSEKKLIQRLRKMAAEEGNDFGVIVNKFSDDEAFNLLRHPLTGYLNVDVEPSSQEARIYFNAPIHMDKLDVKTGNRTPVRGLQFVPMDTKSLRSLTAGGKKKYLYEPRAVFSILCPTLLFELLDLKTRERNFPRLPYLE